MPLFHCASCQFLEDVFQRVTAQQTSVLIPISSEQLHLFKASQMQSPSSWKMLHFARSIAERIINPQGKIDPKSLLFLTKHLSSYVYSLGLDGEQEALGMEMILTKLQILSKNLDVEAAFKRVRMPYAQEHASHLIRRALLLSSSAPLSDALARKAALSAWLAPLRQSVGSCFATAPAILIHHHQPLQFFSDLAQIFGTGALKRTFQGYEYSVPLTAHVGLGALRFPVEWESLGEDPFQSLSLAPGLLAAFKAAGILQQEEKNCADLLKRVWGKKDFSFATFTAENLISEVLLQVYEVTSEEVEEQRLQQIHMPFLGSGFVHRIGTKKSKACEDYLKAYDAAKESFVAQTEHPLLKAWEFTLASFAEVKADTSRWNLCISLGLESEQEDGLTALIHRLLQSKIEKINEEIAHFQSMYDHTYAQVKSLEIRARHVSTEQEARWIQSEYRVQRVELDRILDRRDETHEKGKQLVSTWQILVSFYLDKFPSYFQEVYDAGMKEVNVGIYDDMPAGFRLLYKHGRNNPSVWTLLYHAPDYIQALSAFFTATETELSQKKELNLVQREVSQLITEIILAIREPTFLEKSIYRLANHYQEPTYKHPLKHLDQVKRTPWSYVSGGTMGTLVSTYFGHTTPPTEVKRWIEREVELLVFYLDTLKELPLTTQKKMIDSPQGGLLAYSPTHAFILKPAWDPFIQGWQNQSYTYSWVRDHWIAPQEAFWSQQWLEPLHQEWLQQYLIELFPKGYQHLVSQALKGMPGQRLLPVDWRAHVASLLSYETWLKPVYTSMLDHIDQILLEHLPFCFDVDLAKHLVAIWDMMPSVDNQLKAKLMQVYQQEHPPVQHIVSACDIQHLAQALLMLASGKTATETFYIKELIQAMRSLKLRAPAPILFADPNWEGKSSLGFVVNPGTGQLELWTFDMLGVRGRPLSAWKSYLDGRAKKDWGIYVKPHEYGMV